MADRDIVDDIDALVDEQLQQERSGYDHNVNQEFCPHCGRHWHGLPLTAEVAMMYAAGIYDPAYSFESDDSPVVCPGSTFIGPMPDVVATVRVPLVSSFLGPRGHEADLVLFDEAAGWLNPQPKRMLAAMVGWGAVWLVGAVMALHLPGWWIVLGFPVQYWALQKLIRAGRARWTSRSRRSQAADLCDDDFCSDDSEHLGQDWSRYYNGFGFSCSGQGYLSVRATLAEWRTDDGS